MSNEELKQNLTSPNQWIRLIYMVLFAVLLEVAAFVMLAVVIAQFLFAIVSGSANDNLRRLGDQIASYIYQTLQFLIYNSEEKPFPFSEWPESEEEDLSSYESAEEVDGEIISADLNPEDDVAEAEAELLEPERPPQPAAKAEGNTESAIEPAPEVDLKEEPAQETSADLGETQETPKETKPRANRKSKKSRKTAEAEEETVIELGADSAVESTETVRGESSTEKSTGDK
ncbi:DUF4389 domain-containing protein [Microbulbifer bruguierae]|uniref:DUF4389 domain-containing protein n=1 Tax=Microbulbifer bruguierae TaxID=3029061 RepID=A0ABY8NHG8_9GAMM|nr:DUF4389 domain-containing protein [Microbulbifer bruguierae]WGL17854.1 DUF4389 domain-containing protein [Microbulbifer bruguierae]